MHHPQSPRAAQHEPGQPAVRRRPLDALRVSTSPSNAPTRAGSTAPSCSTPTRGGSTAGPPLITYAPSARADPNDTDGSLTTRHVLGRPDEQREWVADRAYAARSQVGVVQLVPTDPPRPERRAASAGRALIGATSVPRPMAIRRWRDHRPLRCQLDLRRRRMTPLVSR
jgi:hypothetical protein